MFRREHEGYALLLEKEIITDLQKPNAIHQDKGRMTKGIWEIIEVATPITGPEYQGLRDRTTPKEGLQVPLGSKHSLPRASPSICSPHSGTMLLSQSRYGSSRYRCNNGCSSRGHRYKPWWCLHGAISIGAWNAQVLGVWYH